MEVFGSESIGVLRQLSKGASQVEGLPKDMRVKYPTRLFRYWFMERFFALEISKKKSLSVCEIGIGQGQLPKLLLTTSSWGKSLLPKWTGVDCDSDAVNLSGEIYDSICIADVEADTFGKFVESSEHQGKYDVVVVLHFLEHLKNPEIAFQKIVTLLKPGGVVFGGMPCTPECFRALWEPVIRKKASQFGHYSVFSPARLTNMFQSNALNAEVLRGGFLLRKKNLFLENYSWWTRFNIFFGRLFPSWPGEIYFMARK